MTSTLSYKPFVSYDLEIARDLQNRTAAALVSKLEYWFAKYAHGFYKFMEPCAHKLYRTGDSWTEEIGVARRTLTRAFDLIGVRYKSKSLFKAEEDPFKGKPFASYVDNDTNQTFYLQNPEFLKAVTKPFKKKISTPLKGQGVTSQNVRRATDKMAGPYKDNKNNLKENLYPPKSPIEKKPLEKKGEGSFKKIFEKKKRRPHTITKGPSKDSFESSLQDQKDQKTSSLDVLQQAQEILDIWQEETRGQVKTPTLTSHFATKILAAFEKHFEKCLEKWRLFCRLCGSSKWLMGETGSDFKAWLIWILKDKVIQAIRERRYGVSNTLPLTPVKKVCKKRFCEEITLLYEGREREKRLGLLDCFGPERYRRDFASMTLDCLEDGRFFLTFVSSWETRATAQEKQTLLAVFQSESFEAVPARMPLQTYLNRWNLEDAARHPCLFITS